MIEFNSEHKQSILSSENFSALANQNLIIEKVLTLIRFFKRNSELESDLSSWKSIKNDDSNNQNFFNWLSTESSSMNKISNKKSHQSKSMMFRALDSDENYFQKLQWFFHEEIEEYNESWDSSWRTDSLLFISLCSEFHISVSISSELNIIHFSQHLSAQDLKQIYLIIEDYNTIQFCFKKHLDEINENLSNIIW